ncbi:MAG: Tn7 transposase TnsA N-terminal domain-containing protein, partial [Chlorobium sp.]|nr:Tn7 transposase TnsA N-terminal domain-containing protein [Chlorobium sp.]
AHPTYPGTQTPIVMTSDIVLTFNDNGNERHAVISVKRSESLDPEDPMTQRTYEKLLIEKTYWQRRNIQWRVSTEENISVTRAMNLDSLRTSMVARELDRFQKYMDEFLYCFNRRWKQSLQLKEIIRAVAVDLKLDDYLSFMLFGRAIWLRLLPVDLDSEIINHHYPLKRASIHPGGPYA